MPPVAAPAAASIQGAAPNKAAARAGDTVAWTVLFSYGSLALPLAIGFLALQVFVPTYYAGVLGMSLTSVGVILLLARLWDTVTDPLIGYASERTPAWLGRRRIWVLCGVPVLALACWALFDPPSGAGAGYLLFWSAVVYMAGTMVIVPMNAWGAELSPDYHQRSRVSGARVIFGLVGTLVALVAPTLLGQGDARDLGEALETIAFMVVVGLGISGLLVLRFVPDRSTVVLRGGSILAAFSVLRGRTPFPKLLGCYLLNGIANALPATLFLLFATHVVQRPDLAGPWMAIYFSSMIVGTPIWVRFARSFGKDTCWRVGMAIACLAFSVVPFIGPGDEAIFVAVIVITGLAGGADLVLPASMQADMVDWDTLRTKSRRPGIFFAIWGTATKASFALAIGLAFPILDLVGFDASAEASNPPEQIMVLVTLYAIVPIALKLAALYFFRRYPLTPAAHARIRRRLEQRGALEPAAV
jgi:Na+/melibiose symporter-like transporter